MATPKLTRKAWTWKAPHIGTEVADEIKKQIVDDYLMPILEGKPPLLKLFIVVNTTR